MPINDATAVRIADDIYTRLTENGTAAPAVGQTAHALHHAIRRLRTDYTAGPALWAAHIHAGI
ncbi:hypothetical protein [Streptosporangium sp. 'caverna']|uniref:hypothetical protein n=1 Tax=Streptosporangium sp. 'caverna' TaxID=2202249 RepID=UPI000D7DCB11|nr:hypothetical protein [Streptosporangium sp. 'caverna']AWS43394.1 hypothetical protein DKM19_20455 [Streptosporangium sp. 'caverna']